MIEVYAQAGDEATVKFFLDVAYVTGLEKYVVYLRNPLIFCPSNKLFTQFRIFIDISNTWGLY